MSLADLAVDSHLPEAAIRERSREIERHLLSESRCIRAANFTSIHSQDLALLFDAYDTRVFEGECRKTLDGRRLRFRLSTRMTHTGGKTTRFRTSSGDVLFEIAIACGLLFDGFGARDRTVTVCGLECNTRLEALQRIFEHEIVHLIEQLCWVDSDCAGPRFQTIAGRHFLHREHTHRLITRNERAASAGIRTGALVEFPFEGRRLEGRVNRITKRATILVEDALGQPFSDGRRYKTYYVPIALLSPVLTAPEM
ncbi:MAG TPA: SprT-like family protein [Terriglobia bacterium]|jgi:hypothetical protein